MIKDPEIPKDKIRPAFYWSMCSLFIVCHMAFFLSMNKFKLDILNKNELVGSATEIILPLFTLLILSVIPRSFRDSLVHLKITNPLPGCEAFSRWAKEDPRVSMEVLKTKHGRLPTKKSKEQNAKWYGIYQTVKSQPEIISAQQKYILFRDLTLIQVCAIFSWVLTIPFFARPTLLECVVMIVIYGILMSAAKNSSIRFVQTVLAVSINA